MKILTLKQLSTTRWESRAESIKTIPFQIFDIRESLLEVAENDNDPMIQSEAKSLALKIFVVLNSCYLLLFGLTYCMW